MQKTIIKLKHICVVVHGTVPQLSRYSCILHALALGSPHHEACCHDYQLKL